MGRNTYYVYILTNHYGSSLYTGVTSDLERRLYEHKHKLTGGFTAHYNIGRLVYYEATDGVEGAILREKQIKSWGRAKKVALIAQHNPQWRDLSEEWEEEEEAKNEARPM